MEVFESPRQLPDGYRGAVLALGNFDGMHLGHQSVLARTRALAAKAGKPAGVLTFEPHPRAFFKPDQPLFRLTQPAEKLELIDASGADFAVVLTFDAALAATSAREFAADILCRRLSVGHVVAGFNFHFGKGRAGTPDVLTALGKELGIGVTIMEPAAAGDAVYSSSAIRTLLGEGKVAEASQLLGYRWFVRGTVISGDQRGRALGFPTANMALSLDTGLAHGIYAVRLRRNPDGSGEQVHDGVASFGVRPTFGGGRPLLETFIFDFSGDLYGESAEVEFIGRIRGEEKFASVEALVERMNEDCRQARALLAAAADQPLDFPLARARRLRPQSSVK